MLDLDKKILTRSLDIAECGNCHSVVSLTHEARDGIREGGKQNTLIYLDNNVECCGRPDYWWRG